MLKYKKEDSVRLQRHTDGTDIPPAKQTDTDVFRQKEKLADRTGRSCIFTRTGQAMNRNTIGENIRRLRRQQDLKQDVLAFKLHIKRQTLSAYERGITVPDIYVLIRVADYFGITLDELTGRRNLIIPNEKE